MPSEAHSAYSSPTARTSGSKAPFWSTSPDENFGFNTNLPLYLTLGGNDTVCVRGVGTVYLFTGAGNDTVIVSDSGDQTAVWGGTGNDTISVLGSGSLEAMGEAGDDTLIGGTERDDLNGGDGQVPRAAEQSMLRIRGVRRYVGLPAFVFRAHKSQFQGLLEFHGTSDAPGGVEMSTPVQPWAAH